MTIKRVLLGHLNSMGDCLFATVIARQIKEVDYPHCHLTWAVNSKCKQAVLLNRYVDDLWEVPTENALTSIEEWNSFVAEAERKKENGQFDVVLLTQIFGDNWINYDGGIRSSIYNNYPHEITVPHTPVIQLSAEEVANVRRFAEEHELAKYRQVILVECRPDSFTTALNPQSAAKLSTDLTSENKDTAIVLSSNTQIDSESPNVIDASSLSFRENAELTKYCDLFIGCASGISWLATTDWAKKLNMILVINQEKPPFPSMIYDHEYLNLPTDHLIEIKNNEQTIEKLKACVKKISTEDFTAARKSFHETIKLRDYFFLEYQLRSTVGKLAFGKCLASLRRSVKRNGVGLIFIGQFVKTILNLQLTAARKLLKSLGLIVSGKARISRNKY